MAGSSTPPTDPLFHCDPPHSAPNAAGAPRLPGVPVRAHGTSGGASPHSECRMVEVHGVKVASFTVNGAELICLPQVFELFLKHLVGGLHTVYTKLKRLDVSPVVCTVEQVRVLRGLGAIQPGVNRCKLISRADFETLYRDCTNASSRPGRPPKRTLGMATMTDSRLLPRGLLSSALLPQTGLTAAAMAEALKLQRIRMMMGFHGNSEQQRHHSGAESENDDTGGSEGSWEKEQRLLSPPSSVVTPPPGSLHLNTLQQQSSVLANRLSDLPFMVMPHPLFPVGLPPASVAMAMNQMSQLSSLANMATVPEAQTEERKEACPTGNRSPCFSPSDDELHPQEPTSQSPSGASSSSSSSPPHPAHTPELDMGAAERESMKKALRDKDRTLPLPLNKSPYEKLPLTSQPLSINQANAAFTPFLLAEGLSSMETLLTNIQGLLKVAVESARSQDKHNQLERKELKLELEQERDARQALQRQLSSELQARASIQRRLKKEKKAKRRLQEALDFEARRRKQVERALQHSDSLTDAETPESEVENKQQENSAAPENRLFTKPPLLL
ncbi:dachshund a isoform X2 [Mastacembelus armatus]|uniref:Dachshund a n=1 Tax=Mastacembelus armatus TaxID=205130 RepID=A0A7N9AW44_9TELE|nr:dachshund homolog 2-like isoform X2 [Mastacembelus armatus]